MPPVWVPKDKMKEYRRRDNIGCLVLLVVAVVLYFAFGLY